MQEAWFQIPCSLLIKQDSKIKRQKEKDGKQRMKEERGGGRERGGRLCATGNNAHFLLKNFLKLFNVSKI